jgi:hypothetical protein
MTDPAWVVVVTLAIVAGIGGLGLALGRWRRRRPDPDVLTDGWRKDHVD